MATHDSKEWMALNRAGVTPVANSGVNTGLDPAQLDVGAYSRAVNVRLHGPGFRFRGGLTDHHTDDLGNNIYSLYSYKRGERFYAQLSNGDVYEATNNPPTVAAGAFGSLVLDESALKANGTGDVLPGSWSQFRGSAIFSEGSLQHLIRPKIDGAPALVIHWRGATIKRILEDGNDITDSMTDDGNTDTSGSLSFTDANADSIFICTDFPAESFYFDIATPLSGTSPDVDFYYFNGNTWVLQATSPANPTWQADGAITRDSFPVSAERPTVMFGRSGYWYRFKPSSDDATPTVTFSQIYYNAPFSIMQNVMDEVPQFIIEAQIESSSGSTFQTYPASTINAADLAAGDYIYFATADPAWAIYAEVGGTPNETASTAIDGLDVWTGNGNWTSLMTGKEDGTNGLANTGYISWNRLLATPQKRAFNDNKNYMYWYRVKFDKVISSSVILSLSSLSYHSLDKLGAAGKVSTMWKDRGCFTFSKYSRDIYVSKKYRINVLNGDDYAILNPGDGREHDVTAMLQFNNELMVFQEEIGKEGGCLTLFEGYSPITFGRLVLSTRLGTFSQSSVCIIDGATQTTRTTDVTQILVCFISKYGIFLTDGRTIRPIYQDIDDIFDPEKPNYINTSPTISHWVGYDRSTNCLRFGIATGANTVPNLYPVYHLDAGFWTFDEFPDDHTITCFGETTAESGNIDTLQHVGVWYYDNPTSVNKVMRSVPGQTYDVDPSGDGESIVGTLRMEFNNGGNQLEIRELVLRSNDLSDYTLTKRAYINGELDSTETETFNMAAESGKDVYRERILEKLDYDYSFAVELSWTDTESETIGVDWTQRPVLYDFVHEIYSSPNLN